MLDRYLTRLAAGHLPIFSFHKVPAELDPLYPQDLDLATYSKTVEFIVERFRIIPLPEAIDAARRKVRLPDRAACITFDDGYPGWLERVVPVLEAHSAHATFYITTGQFSGTPMWHERIHQCVAAFSGAQLFLPGLGLPPLAMTTLEEKKKALVLLETHLKYQPLAVRDVMLRELEDMAGVRPQTLPVMTADEVRAIHNRGFTIGGHSVNHPILTQCDEKSAFFEISACKEQLEAVPGTAVEHFAYPNGRPYKDYDLSHVDMLRRCGYKSAVSTAAGVNDIASSMYQIPRFTPWGPKPLKMVVQMVRNLRSTALEVRQPNRKIKVLSVENGGGFGGAVVALRTLIQHLPAEQCEMYLALNLKSLDLSNLPALKGTAIINDRTLNTRLWADRLRPRQPRWLVRIALIALGRVDDLVNRLPYLLRLLAYAISVRPDIIHGNNDPEGNREAILLSRLLRLPYIQHLRGDIAPGTVSPALLRYPDAYIAVSRWLAGELLTQGLPAERIHHIYDAIDFPASAAGQPSGLMVRPQPAPDRPLVVAMVGMLVSWKGQRLFIDAVQELRDSLPRPVRFLIVGSTPEFSDGAYEQALREQVSAAGLNELIEFTGHCHDMPGLLAQTDIAVSASLEPEPLGLVMLEALVAGCLFIAPAYGAATEVIRHGENGFLFVPGNAKSLAAQIIEAINTRHKMSFAPPAVDADFLRNFSGALCAEKTLAACKLAAPGVGTAS